MKVYNVDKDDISWIREVEEVENLKDADLVLFSSKGDVFHKLYNSKEDKTFSKYNKLKDVADIKIFIEARANDKPCLGINRGYLLLSALSGSDIIEDIEHPSEHDVQLINEKVLKVTSEHHQICYPWSRMSQLSEFHIIGFCSALSTKQYYYRPDITTEKTKDIEVIYYDRSRCACTLFKPSSEETIEFMNSLIVSLINKTIRKDFVKPKGKKSGGLEDYINKALAGKREPVFEWSIARPTYGLSSIEPDPFPEPETVFAVYEATRGMWIYTNGVDGIIAPFPVDNWSNVLRSINMLQPAGYRFNINNARWENGSRTKYTIAPNGLLLSEIGD